MQQGNIAPVDLAQAAIGPGMAIFTRYARVLDAGGKAVSVREALALINETLDEVLAEQEGDFDADTRWALAWFDQSGFSEGEYGVAETLSTAKNTSVAGMVEAGILTSGGGKVRLLAPAELPQDWDPKTDSRRTVWETTHHLVRVHEQGGDAAAADIMANIGADAETARDLAYRLYPHLRPAQPPSRGVGLQRPGPQLGGNFRPGNSGAASPDRAEYVRWGVSHGRHQQRAGWEGARPAERRVGSLRGPGSEGRPFSANQLQDSDLQRFTNDPMLSKRPVVEWDVAGLLALMWETWNQVFRQTLGPAERGLVGELRGHRTRWAHQEPFSTDDAYRALDSTHRLLSSVSSPQAGDVETMKMELLRLRFNEQARSQRRRTTSPLADNQATGGLPPWREVVSPHQDVAGGQYQQAEFAADLWQVYLGGGVAEYQDPIEFFRRTFLTDSLRRLLINGVKRLSDNDGDPVVQLQTNFGGGKTHSMLALFHLFSRTSHSQLPGIDDLMQEAGTLQLPAVKRVVLVGNRISPGSPAIKADGTEVRTLWGELAWQLGYASGGASEARKAYERVRADDEQATNPGDALRELLNDYGPCLILIDEWVAYARQLHEESDLPAGSFGTHFTFAQALSESAKLANNCLLVISLPASDADDATADVEVGGLRGRQAIASLRNVIGRIDSSWRPASAEESFEIVRRRLFQPIADQANFIQRDNVARAYCDLYRNNSQEFPSECGETAYEDRIKAAYPIHPEVFERLYTDWSTLQNFQRTRGVLRLMASVIHSLWDNGDRSPLIMPANILLDDPPVQSELNRYLPDNWPPVIERDIDGPNSLPTRIDGEAPNLGRYGACRRVARSIFLGSAPIQTAANQGLEDRRIKLGCVNPGEPPAIFGDAMRRLANTAAYLYQDGARYWYSTQPTVATLAEGRAEEYRRNRDPVDKQIEVRLRADLSNRGDFKAVHVLPASGQDVQDDHDARLVVLGPNYPHTREQEADSRAVVAAKAILEFRGSSPRLFRNGLAFLAPDQARLQDLEDAVRHYLAWQSILDDRERLDLPPHQVRQAENRKQESDNAVRARIGEAYQWLLAPAQSSPTDALKWESIRLTAQGAWPNGPVNGCAAASCW